jgi:predicted MFS family arabinose efflux permease
MDIFAYLKNYNLTNIFMYYQFIYILMKTDHNHSYKIFFLAIALSLGATVSLGITRFAYGLLLPPMRADLSWSYTLSGAMSTINAFGYFLGAMITPKIIQRWGAVRVLLFGSLLSSFFMGITGFFLEYETLLFQRLLAGIASAFIFVSGGVLSARLGSILHEKSGFIVGIYYGGTGWGILLSAIVIPIVLQNKQNENHSWIYAWWTLALVCFICTAIILKPMIMLHEMGLDKHPQTNTLQSSNFSVYSILPALLGYACFGIGYIGYMTFVVLLLKEQGVDKTTITIFYSLLGIFVVASAWIWSSLLGKAKAGGAIATLNSLLGLAAIIPALTNNILLLFLSGCLFGSVFLSVVASTTAFVRHNLPSEQWTKGISLFTIIFAMGQIVGPTVVGFIADGSGGVEKGLIFSSVVLWIGSILALKQKQLYI